MNDDNECMARLAAGDANALRELYQRHGRALLRFSSAMCRSRQAAEDLVHDAFVALLREPLNFDPALGTVFAYLCGVLRHRVSRHFRHEKRWVALDTDNDSSPAHRSDEARALQHRLLPMARLISAVHGVPGLKAALLLTGVDVGRPRPPLLPAEELAVSSLREALVNLEEVTV
jgi:RNA polymerase sigma-70 factor (ECF subfamily)